MGKMISLHVSDDLWIALENMPNRSLFIRNAIRESLAEELDNVKISRVNHGQTNEHLTITRNRLIGDP